MFAANGFLMKFDVTAGTVERFIRLLRGGAAGLPFVTGSWSSDGNILFFDWRAGGALHVGRRLVGSSPVAITTLNGPRYDQYHSWPQLLDGG